MYHVTTVSSTYTKLQWKVTEIKIHGIYFFYFFLSSKQLFQIIHISFGAKIYLVTRICTIRWASCSAAIGCCSTGFDCWRQSKLWFWGNKSMACNECNDGKWSMVAVTAQEKLCCIKDLVFHLKGSELLLS